MKDLQFISGEFLDYDLPKELKYLGKYFKTRLQRVFLRFYLTFGNLKNFTDHTGFRCSERVLFNLKNKCDKLVNAYHSAKIAGLSEESLEAIHKLESGKFVCSKKTE